MAIDSEYVERNKKDPHALRSWVIFLAVFSLMIATVVCTRGWLEAFLDIFLIAPVFGCVAEMHDAHGKLRGGFVPWLTDAAPIFGPGCALAFIGCLLRLTREISNAGYVIALCMGLISLGVTVKFAQAYLAGRIEKKVYLARHRPLR